MILILVALKSILSHILISLLLLDPFPFILSSDEKEEKNLMIFVGNIFPSVLCVNAKKDDKQS